MTTLSIALFVFALALLAVPLLPRLNAFRQSFFPVLTLLALGVCYSQKTMLNPMARLFFSEGFQQGWEAPAIEPSLDSDEDGLSDEIEKSGYFPRVIPLDSTIFDRPEGAIDLWTGWAGTHEVAEWPFGDDFSFPVHTNSFTKASVSQSGMLCFGGALNSTVPVLYPLENIPQNRLRRGIAQFAFFQGLNRIAPMAENGSQVFHYATDEGTRRLVFKNIFLDDLSVTANAAVELFADGRLRFSYDGNLPLPRRVGWHVGEGGLMVTDLTGGVTLELLAFPPTDPNNPDTDGDNASDYDEVAVYDTNPTVVDTDHDGDGVSDALEIALGTDPYDPNSVPDAALMALDSDGDGFPDWLERLLGTDPDDAEDSPSTETTGGCVLTLAPAEAGAGISTLVCENISYPVLPDMSQVTVRGTFGQIASMSWIGTPRVVTDVLGLNGTLMFYRSTAPVLSRMAVMTTTAQNENITDLGFARVAFLTGGGANKTVCIHPQIGSRRVDVRIEPPPGILGDVKPEQPYWSWSGYRSNRTFSSSDTTCHLGIDSSDRSSLGTLRFTATVSHTGLSSWRAQRTLSVGALVKRCPSGEEEEEEPEICVHGIPLHECPEAHAIQCPTHHQDRALCQEAGFTTEQCYPSTDWCETHKQDRVTCREAGLTEYECKPSHPEWCLTHGRPKSVCKDEGASGCDSGDGTGETTNAWCHVHSRDREICEKDPDLTSDDCIPTTWCEIHERPITLCREEDIPEEDCEPKTEFKCKNNYLTVELHDSLYLNSYSMKLPGYTTRGECCNCIDHGPQGSEPSARDITSTPGITCNPSDYALYHQLPGFFTGTQPSTAPYADNFSYIHHYTIITNHITVGRLKIEPALSRHREPLTEDIRAWDTLRKDNRATLFLDHRPGSSIYLNLRTDIAITNGYFTLSLTGEPDAFELIHAPYDPEDLLPIQLATGQSLDIAAQTWLGEYQMGGAIPLRLIIGTGGTARLTYTYTLSTEHGLIFYRDTMPIKTLPPALLPDYNRDGLWDETDLTAAHTGETFKFWQNSDDDASDDDIPQNTEIYNDGGDLKVNGPKDFADFFPLRLNLREHLAHFSPDHYTYTLTAPADNINVWSYSLTPEGAQWLGDPKTPQRYLRNAAEARDFSKAAYNKTQRLNSSIELSAELLTSIKENNVPHALLFEGRYSPSLGKLELTITPKDNKNPQAFTHKAPLLIVPVETMFHYHNLLSVAGRNDNTIRDLYVPAYAPWGQDSQKQLFFCHGYNVSSIAVRAWGCELFKRFFWSGSQAEFNMVHWYGFKSKTLESIPPTDFHSNVVNAFKTAPALASLIGSKRESASQITLAGHSLGCMLVSAAVCLENAPVDDLIIVNAAVAQEAYDSETTQAIEMTHEDMRVYATAGLDHLFASEWHTLFLDDVTDDPRSKLTIRGLFANKNGARFHQFHSTGEDVTGNVPLQTSVIAQIWNGNKAVGRYAWGVQELWKGCSYEPFGPGAIIGSTWMGWSVNSHYRRYYENWEIYPIWSIPDLAQVSENTLITEPFFDKAPSELFVTNSVSAMAYAQTNRFEIIARAIPARTFSAGANELDNDNTGFDNYVDMNSFVNSEESGLWLRTTGSDPTKWKHSDIRDMPYVNVSPFFKRVVDIANR